MGANPSNYRGSKEAKDLRSNGTKGFHGAFP